MTLMTLNSRPEGPIMWTNLVHRLSPFDNQIWLGRPSIDLVCFRFDLALAT